MAGGHKHPKTTTTISSGLPSTGKPTSTSIVVSTSMKASSDALQPVYLEQWRASVRRAAATTATLSTGTVSFRLTDGKALLADFSPSRGTGRICTFTETVTATDEVIRSVAPHLCTGGSSGSVTLTPGQVQSPATSVEAVFMGAPGWAVSCSAPLNPERVGPKAPGTAGPSQAHCP